MAQFWFFVTDPKTFHLDALFRKGRDVWDGVYGANAQKHLGQVQQGDCIVGYHTAPEKAAYALLEAVSNAYPDPKEKDKMVWVVDVKPLRKLAKSVPLQALRAAPKLVGMKFLRIPRLAVSPLTAVEYGEILRLGGEKQ